MTTQAETLKQAILARAERLAQEFRERGQRARDSILRDAAEKRRLREQREEAIAKGLGERAYRQQVQARELGLQSDLDHARWALVTRIEARLAARMREHMADEAAYLETLAGFIASAVEAIDRPALSVHANAKDLERLAAHWDAICARLPEGRELRRDTTPLATLGGVLVVAEDARLRVDHTFEGRLARLRASLQHKIQERLLQGGFDTGNIFGG